MNFYLPRKEAEFVKSQPRDFLVKLVRAYMEKQAPERPRGPEAKGPGLPRYGK